MKQYWRYLMFAAVVLCCACNKDDDEEEDYPSIISEFVDIYANEQGSLYKFINDADKTYQLTNPQTGYKAKAIYRAVCGYVAEGNSAHVYQLAGAYILRDSTQLGKQDPINIESAWRAGHYINMQLAPLSQGGTQYWGFIVDSISSGHAFVSLYHNQNNDPTSYTQTTYASLPVDSIKGIQAGDSITLHIHTFKGTQTWHFKK